MSHSKDVIVETLGYYLAVCDIESPANSPGVWKSLNQSECGSVSNRVDTFIASAAEHGHAAIVPLYDDGVFKVRLIHTLRQGLDLGDGLPNDLKEDYRGVLHLKTGRMIVASLDDLGTERRMPSFEIEPGAYAIRVLSDREQQLRHEFLEGLHHYPMAEGPDFVVPISPV